MYLETRLETCGCAHNFLCAQIGKLTSKKWPKKCASRASNFGKMPKKCTIVTEKVHTLKFKCAGGKIAQKILLFFGFF